MGVMLALEAMMITIEEMVGNSVLTVAQTALQAEKTILPKTVPSRMTYSARCGPCGQTWS